MRQNGALGLKKLTYIRGHITYNLTMDIDDLAKRNHIELEYIKKLGFALYAFSSAEDHAIWCCEKLVHGFYSSWTKQDWAQAKKLARKLGHQAGSAVKIRESIEYKNNLKELVVYAERFHVLADNGRNNLLHALPAGDNGETILHNRRQHILYREPELEQFIVEALACREYFNSALHGYLKDYFG